MSGVHFFYSLWVLHSVWLTISFCFPSMERNELCKKLSVKIAFTYVNANFTLFIFKKMQHAALLTSGLVPFRFNVFCLHWKAIQIPFFQTQKSGTYSLVKIVPDSSTMGMLTLLKTLLSHFCQHLQVEAWLTSTYCLIDSLICSPYRYLPPCSAR